MFEEKRLLFPFLEILILLLFFTFNSGGHNNDTSSSCTPSSCGHLTEIRYPFRLKTDPKSCGHYNTTYFEVDCQNKQAILSVNSKRYIVRDISYKTLTIRLADPGINRGNLSSCPLYSNTYMDWPYPVFLPYSFGLLDQLNMSVAFIHCLSRIYSAKYVKAPFCGNTNNVFGNSSEFYSYVMVGETLLVSDLEESCAVDRVDWGPLVMGHNRSLASIYDGLSYGFELQFSSVYTRQYEYVYSQIKPFIDSLRPVYIIAFSGILIAAVVGITVLKFVIGFPLLIWLVVHKWRRRHLSMDENIEKFLQDQRNLTPIKYTFLEIKKMTNNFTQRLGEGGHGVVYKGKLRSGPYVAIKMMGQSMATEEDFISEVSTLGQIHHVNIVRLIGFCVERAKYALVYEFLPNGSLDRYIFNQQSLGVLALTYEKMFDIALGVARGIEYLHHGCNMQILHFDIKPRNILLDEKFNPKISDFGLARQHPSNESCINLTVARGTVGYMAPELFYQNITRISYKADVYSFGMMLMEMLSRRKEINPFVEDTSQIQFPLWVYNHLCAGNDIDVEDATKNERKMVNKMIMVALWCIQMRPTDRPPMSKVVEMLDGDVKPHMPPKPFIAPREMGVDDHAITRTYTVDYIKIGVADN